VSATPVARSICGSQPSTRLGLREVASEAADVDAGVIGGHGTDVISHSWPPAASTTQPGRCRPARRRSSWPRLNTPAGGVRCQRGKRPRPNHVIDVQAIAPALAAVAVHADGLAGESPAAGTPGKKPRGRRV